MSLCFRARQQQTILLLRLNFSEARQVKRLDPLVAIDINFNRFQVEFISLRVYYDSDPAFYPLRSRLFRQCLIAAHAQQLYVSRQLPPLRRRDSGPNSRVRTWAKANGDALDLFALEPRLAERSLDHRHQRGLSCLDDFRDRRDSFARGGIENRHASLRG